MHHSCNIYRSSLGSSTLTFVETWNRTWLDRGAGDMQMYTGTAGYPPISKQCKVTIGLLFPTYIRFPIVASWIIWKEGGCGGLSDRHPKPATSPY